MYCLPLILMKNSVLLEKQVRNQVIYLPVLIDNSSPKTKEQVLGKNYSNKKEKVNKQRKKKKQKLRILSLENLNFILLKLF